VINFDCVVANLGEQFIKLKESYVYVYLFKIIKSCFYTIVLCF